MALARVVTFEGVSKDRMDEMDREMREGQPPEGFPAMEVVALHDAWRRPTARRQTRGVWPSWNASL